jgi:hypothetical protein
MTTSVVDLEVPETLQALVASRLDGLSGSERRRVTSLLPPAGAAASVALGTEAQRYFEHAMELSNDDLERAGLLEQAGQALWQSGTPPAPSSVCARQPSSTGAATLPWRAVRRCCSPQSCACRAISTRHAPCLGDSGQRRDPASTGSFAEALALARSSRALLDQFRRREDREALGEARHICEELGASSWLSALEPTSKVVT